MAGTLQNEPELQGFLVPNVRPTGRPLGHGAYGSVEEVQIPGALCAAKKIHDTLLRMGSPDEVRNMTAKFVEECQLMSSLRHPHVVQFLGICFLPGSRVPALIMEKLLTSVDELLERNPNIPLSIKRGILHDVARGLDYLHSKSPPLIHRDLTAKNVLLNSAMMAKLADLGVARIVDVQPGQLAAMTRAPGTIVYMPPEALEPRAKYDTKIDIFSLGNLAMYILTQIFPELLAPTYVDPKSKRLVTRSEIERRIEYIRQIHQQLRREHPLVQMVEWCLENSPEDRPTIVQVLRQLEQARALIPDRFEEMNKLEMVQQLQLLQEPLQQLQSQEQQIRDLQAEVLAKEAENRRAVQALSEKERENQQLQVQLQSKGVEIRNLQSSSTKQDPQQAQLVTDLLSQVQQLQLEKEQLQKLHPPRPQMPHPSPGQQLPPTKRESVDERSIPQQMKREHHPPPLPEWFKKLNDQLAYIGNYFGENIISEFEADSISQNLRVNKTLEDLTFQSVRFSTSGLSTVLSALRENKSVKTLRFYNMTFSDTDSEGLAQVLRINTTIEALRFDNVKFSTNGLATVIVALSENKSVKTLRFWNMALSDTDSEVLVQVLRINTTIATLQLYQVNISDVGFTTLAEAVRDNQSLTTLELGGVNISDVGFTTLAEAVQDNQSLTTLQFNNVKFSTNGLSTVLSALRENKSVKDLGFYDNMAFSDTDSEVLVQVLHINTTIETMRLGGVNISDVGFTTLAEAIRDNQSLTTLDLSGTKISDSRANALATAIQTNETLQELEVSFQSVSDGGARDFAKKMEGWRSSLKTLMIWHTWNISGEVKELLRETARRKGINLRFF